MIEIRRRAEWQLWSGALTGNEKDWTDVDQSFIKIAAAAAVAGGVGRPCEAPDDHHWTRASCVTIVESRRPGVPGRSTCIWFSYGHLAGIR